MKGNRFLLLGARLAIVPPVGAPFDEIGVVFFFILRVFIPFVDFLLHCKRDLKPILGQINELIFVSTIKLPVLRNLRTICPHKNENSRHGVRKYTHHHEQRQCEADQ